MTSRRTLLYLLATPVVVFALAVVVGFGLELGRSWVQTLQAPTAEDRQRAAFEACVLGWMAKPGYYRDAAETMCDGLSP